MRIPSSVVFITLGFLYQCMPAVEPNVRVWGTNTYHQLDVPTDLTNAVAVSVGDAHVLALRSDGTVVAWGDNGYGQCNVPAGLTNVISINAGALHSMAVKADGTAVFWGALMPLTSPEPPASSLTNIAAVAGGWSALVLKKDGTLAQWGPYGVPSDLTNAVAIAGRYDVLAALRPDGSIRAWGGFDRPLHQGWVYAPMPVTNATAISVGVGHILVLRSDGTVAAYGDNFYGEFDVPPGLTNVIGISAGWGYSFAVRADGTVAAWGTGTRPGCSLPPDLPFVFQISAGYDASAALVRPDQVVSPPTILQQPSPVSLNAVVGGDAFFRVAAGGFPPLSYQWYFGTSAIPNATNTALHLTNLKAEQSGAYKVAVSNPGGTTWSQPATLNVLPGLDVHMVPAITLFGTVGLNYRIDYISPYGAPDSWISLATITLTNSPQFYFDTSAIGQQGRLYRTVQLQ